MERVFSSSHGKSSKIEVFFMMNWSTTHWTQCDYCFLGILKWHCIASARTLLLYNLFYQCFRFFWKFRGMRKRMLLQKEFQPIVCHIMMRPHYLGLGELFQKASKSETIGLTSTYYNIDPHCMIFLILPHLMDLKSLNQCTKSWNVYSIP